MRKPKPITKERAIRIFKGARPLAKALGISPAAVYQWPDGQPIPQKQDWAIRFVLKPDLFKRPRKEPAHVEPAIPVA
jgi:hypothetical protein